MKKNELITESFEKFCKEDPVCSRACDRRAISYMLTPNQVKELLEQAYRSGADLGMKISNENFN